MKRGKMYHKKPILKKSQMEILGLAIVVVIILVATVFFVKFSALKTSANYRGDFISSELASNMLNTLLKTNARECSQLTITELLQDCAQGVAVTCNDGKTSCEFIESIISDKIFHETLDKWNVRYQFLAYTDINSPLIKVPQDPCKSDKKSKLFPIPITVRTMYIKLDVCG